LKLPSFARKKKVQPEDEPLIAFIKNIFGFRPGNIFLYKQAMRHKSMARTIKEGVKDSNERLEFLGDAVLSAIVADYLFKRFPFKEEGFLTETRSKIVSRASLNKLGFKIGIGKHLVTSPDLMKHASSMLLGDAMEALIGAIYLDKGFDFTNRTVIRYLLDIYMDISDVIETEVNFKSRAYEWAQQHKRELEFRVADEIQQRNHQKQYKVQLLLDRVVISEGIDYSIKGAEQRSAEKALLLLSEKDLPPGNA
jgi:ribonuclease-3